MEIVKAVRCTKTMSNTMVEVAHWKTRGGRYWLKLYREDMAQGTRYLYREDAAGGNLGFVTEEAALAAMDKRVWSYATYDGINMKRVAA